MPGLRGTRRGPNGLHAESSAGHLLGASPPAGHHRHLAPPQVGGRGCSLVWSRGKSLATVILPISPPSECPVSARAPQVTGGSWCFQGDSDTQQSLRHPAPSSPAPQKVPSHVQRIWGKPSPLSPQMRNLTPRGGTSPLTVLQNPGS